MKGLLVRIPRGRIYAQAGVEGSANLLFYEHFRRRKQKEFDEAQMFVDAQVLERCEKYTPRLTGALILSGDLGTEIGSGVVKWIVHYARAQYRTARQPGRKNGVLRGPFWFERMWEAEGQIVTRKAKKYAGGSAKPTLGELGHVKQIANLRSL